MRRGLTLMVAMAWLAFVPAARGDDSNEIKKLQDEWATTMKKWSQEAKKAEEAGKSVDVASIPVIEFRPKFKTLAEKYAGKPEALPALMWLVDDGVTGPDDREGRLVAVWAVEQLAKSHAATPEIVEQLHRLQMIDEVVGKDPMMALYERMIEQNPSRDAKAGATLNLAILHMRETKEGEEAREPPRQASQKMAMKLFRLLKADYAGTKAADRADGYIFEAEHLQIGMKAPDIVGPDADGKEIKLSQFAGKVVILDYWGFW